MRRKGCDSLRDKEIIELFFERSEQAVAALSGKYGAAVRCIALNILGSRQDAEECENDVYLGCWNSIPPQRPDPLKTYVCRIARNIAVTRYHANTAQKRNSMYDAAFEELAECIPDKFSVESEIETAELTAAINTFLAELKPEERVMFVRRYWFSDSVADIAATLGLRENLVSVRLFRVRKKLYCYLTEEGYI